MDVRLTYTLLIVCKLCLFGNSATTSPRREAIFSDLQLDLKEPDIIVEDTQPKLVVNLTAIKDPSSTAVQGTNLWKAKSYFSPVDNGQGPMYDVKNDVLSPDQKNFPLTFDDDLRFPDTDISADLDGVTCTQARYFCMELDKDSSASINYEFDTDPEQDPFVTCVDIRNRCKGVVVADVSWSRTVPDIIPGSEPELVTIDATVDVEPYSSGVTGNCLWKMNLFGSREVDGSGPRQPLSSQILDSFHDATPLSPGGPLYFENVAANFDISQLGCDEIKYLCLEFTQCDNPSPDFSFEVSGGEETIVRCQAEQCQDVYIDDYTSDPISIDLVEGRRSNPVSFRGTASSTEDSATIPNGLRLWKVAIWGSKQPAGSGEQSNLQSQVLDPYYAATPLLSPGDNIDLASIFADFDMTGLRCTDVLYLCSEFTRDPSSYPQFEMEAVPDESVLTHCFEVPEDTCRDAIVVNDLDFDMEFTTFVPGAPDDVSFNIEVSTVYTSAVVDGDNLWRVGFFLSNDSVGTQKNSYNPQILTPSHSGIDPIPGQSLRLSNVNTQVDLTGLGCEDGKKYVCLEFSKGTTANTDFEFEVSGGGTTLVNCKGTEVRIV